MRVDFLLNISVDFLKDNQHKDLSEMPFFRHLKQVLFHRPKR